MLTFWCAPWKRVRIFEGIVGIFQDAHFSKSVRIFEGRAHLRQGLGPAPGAVDALMRAATGFGLVGFGWGKLFSFMRSSLLGRWVEVGRVTEPRAIRKRLSRRAGIALPSESTSLLQALHPLSRFVSMREGPAKKKPRLGLGTAPHERDLQLVAVPSFSKSIMRAGIELVQDQSN